MSAQTQAPSQKCEDSQEGVRFGQKRQWFNVGIACVLGVLVLFDVGVFAPGAYNQMKVWMERACQEPNGIGRNLICGTTAKTAEFDEFVDPRILNGSNDTSSNASNATTTTTTTTSTVNCNVTENIPMQCLHASTEFRVVGNGTVPEKVASCTVDTPRGSMFMEVSDVSRFSVGEHIAIATHPPEMKTLVSVTPTNSTRRLLSPRRLSGTTPTPGKIGFKRPLSGNAPAGTAIGILPTAITTTTHDDSKWWPTWAYILAISGGAVCCLALLGVAALTCCKSKSPKRRASYDDDEDESETQEEGAQQMTPIPQMTEPVLTTSMPMTSYVQPSYNAYNPYNPYAGYQGYSAF